ncbi:MAG: hypothetical protein J3K34DRAFT_411925 [Monoraphidium minutum]|nr:MAG: hypothetical protein J3K34DRAFT_411925 [Monoraphidium minutum]
MRAVSPPPPAPDCSATPPAASTAKAAANASPPSTRPVMVRTEPDAAGTDTRRFAPRGTLRPAFFAAAPPVSTYSTARSRMRRPAQPFTTHGRARPAAGSAGASRSARRAAGARRRGGPSIPYPVCLISRAQAACRATSSRRARSLRISSPSEWSAGCKQVTRDLS